MSRKKWQFALCQHPMYLIIDKDSQCLERTPPWGSKNIWDYINRLRQNLDFLEKYPDLKICYEFSGMELEDLAREAPDVIERMRRLLKEGKISFVNGTYSQPHLQVFGPESNLREFQMGLAVFRKLFDYDVDTYAAQEVGLHEQLPQILIKLGYKYAVTPGFHWTISFLDEHELISNRWKMEPVENEEFTEWQGLDDSRIPLYLIFPGGTSNEALKWEFQKDLYGCPPLRADFPDMVAIDDQWVAKHSENAEFVLLDRALRERMEAAPPKSRARVYTYWSYVEGLLAEDLSRTNKKAETRALQAGALSALASLLVGSPQEDLGVIWTKILGSQHHDVYWAGAPELRETALGWLRESIAESEMIIHEAARSICDQIDTSSVQEGEPVVVFNTYPKTRSDIVEVDLVFKKEDARSLKVRDSKGNEIESQILHGEYYEDESIRKCRLCFLAEAQGLGYSTYTIVPSFRRRKERERSLSKSMVFNHNHYRAKVRPDATFESIYCKPADFEMLDTSELSGNEMKARLSEIGRWVTTRHERAKATLLRGAVVDTLKSSGSLGEAKFRIEVSLYRNRPRIDFDVTFDFDNASYGTFIDDESKMNVYWPLSFEGDIVYDIPFGAVRGRKGRPLFATNWLDVCNEDYGFAYFNRGTPKHWIRERTIANLFAWGGTKITNRLQSNVWWAKEFDLRLRGSHLISYSVFPHAGSWADADIVNMARTYNEPLIAFHTDKHEGKLPQRLSFLNIKSKNIIPTSVERIKDDIRCRVFETLGRKTTLRAEAHPRSHRIRLRSLSEQELGMDLKPFQIANLLVAIKGVSRP